MSYVTVKNGRLNDYYFTGFLYIVYEEFARIELNFLPLIWSKPKEIPRYLSLTQTWDLVNIPASLSGFIHRNVRGRCSLYHSNHLICL